MNPRLFLGLRVTPDLLPLFQNSNLCKTYHEEKLYIGYSLPANLSFEELLQIETRLIQEFINYCPESKKLHPVLFPELWIG